MPVLHKSGTKSGTKFEGEGRGYKKISDTPNMTGFGPQDFPLKALLCLKHYSGDWAKRDWAKRKSSRSDWDRVIPAQL